MKKRGFIALFLLIVGFAFAQEEVKQPVEIKPDEFALEKEPELAKKMESLPREKFDKLVAKLKEAAGNWRVVADSLKSVEGDSFNYLVEMLFELIPLELIETDKETLLEHLECGMKTRKEVRWKYKDEDFIKYVLNPHILYSPLKRWTAILKERFISFRTDDVESTAKALNGWFAKNLKVEKERISFCGWFKTPYEVLRSGSGSENEILSFATAVLRSLGVAARVHRSGKWLEFLKETEWIPLYPMNPERFGSKTATEQAKVEYANKGKLVLTITQKGMPAKGFNSFSIHKVTEKGYFDDVWYPDKPLGDDGKVEVELPPGEYHLFAGVRNANGDPYIFHKTLIVESEKTEALSVALDIPYEEWTEKEWCVRKFQEIPSVSFETADMEMRLDLKHAVKEHKTLLVVFFRLEDEPCQRMVPLLSEFGDKNGVETFLVYLGERDALLNKFIVSFTGKSHILLVKEEDAKERLLLPYEESSKRFKNLPQTLLFKNGNLVAWQEGFNMNIAKLLESALKSR
ncbi:MAG: transglutaminase-like domain-containing protein [Planctomycetota bacterium]|nr:transglutaminase-like domain-containing protein [Planctomycetota bacterium]